MGGVAARALPQPGGGGPLPIHFLVCGTGSFQPSLMAGAPPAAVTRFAAARRAFSMAALSASASSSSSSSSSAALPPPLDCIAR